MRIRKEYGEVVGFGDGSFPESMLTEGVNGDALNKAGNHHKFCRRKDRPGVSLGLVKVCWGQMAQHPAKRWA